MLACKLIYCKYNKEAALLHYVHDFFNTHKFDTTSLKKYFRFIKVSKISGDVTNEVLNKLEQFYDIQNISNEEKIFLMKFSKKFSNKQITKK